VEGKNSPVPALFHRERVSWRACIYRRARLSPIVVANIGVARTPARVDKLRDLAGRCVVAAAAAAAGDRRSQRDRNFHGTASANADATQRRTTAAATDTFPLPSSSAAGPPALPLPRPQPSLTTAGPPVRAPAAKIDAIEVPAANYSRRIAERSEAGVRGGRFSRLRHNSAETRHREIGAKFVSTYEKRKSVNESLSSNAAVRERLR